MTCPFFSTSSVCHRLAPLYNFDKMSLLNSPTGAAFILANLQTLDLLFTTTVCQQTTTAAPSSPSCVGHTKAQKKGRTLLKMAANEDLWLMDLQTKRVGSCRSALKTSLTRLLRRRAINIPGPRTKDLQMPVSYNTQDDRLGEKTAAAARVRRRRKWRRRRLRW